MGRYEKVPAWLRTLDAARVTVTFTEFEAVTGSLPPSARANRTWWGNSRSNSQSAAWVSAGWKVTSVDLSAETVTFAIGDVVTRVGAGRAPILDGIAALMDVVRRAGWPSLEAATAAHCVFLDPATVGQTDGSAIVPVVRDMTRRGELGELPDGRPVLFDDNATPTDVFLWASNRTKGPDVQFNHVWTCARDPDAYTALWNLCCTPAFLAKATDTHADVVALLRYRAWDLYGCRPAREPEPRKPDGYDALHWAPMPEPVEVLEVALRQRMRSAPGRRAALAARSLGWAFSRGPDPTV